MDIQRAHQITYGRRIKLVGLGRHQTVYTHMGTDGKTGRIRLGEGEPAVETTQVEQQQRVRCLNAEEKLDYAFAMQDVQYLFRQDDECY